MSDGATERDTPAGAVGEQSPSKKIEWETEIPWPAPLREEAGHGLIGEAVRIIAPHTEADPNAVHFSLLTAIGNIFGRKCYRSAGNDEHPPRFFTIIVGKSNVGKKGSSFSAIRPLLKMIDPEWYEKNIVSGFASGEALIKYLANDELQDKRCLVFEPELSGLFGRAIRDGNIISPTIRNGWDGLHLENRRSQEQAVARDANLSILGHITKNELQLRLSGIETENGFANRFLFVCSRRSKYLEFGGKPKYEALEEIAGKIREVINAVHEDPELVFGPEAAKLWKEFYYIKRDRDGLLDSLTSRAEAQTLRLCVIYALMDGTTTIQLPHVKAAIACWDRSFGSAEYAFGNLCANKVQDEILRKLRDAYEHNPNKGLTATEIHKQFNGHLKRGELESSLEVLIPSGKVRSQEEREQGAKRSVERFYAVLPRASNARVIEVVSGAYDPPQC